MARRLRILAPLVAAILTASCGVSPSLSTWASSPPPGVSVPPPTQRSPTPATSAPTPASPSPIASASAPSEASAAARIQFDALPAFDAASRNATAICDWEPGQLDASLGEVSIDCQTGLELGVRAVRTLDRADVTRLRLVRPTCVMAPCSDDELNLATVFVTAGRQSYRVDLDGRLASVGAPVPVDNPAWPQPWTSAVPKVRRVTPTGAPANVATRTPLPYCGWSVVGGRPAAERCFLDAVLAGRPAEVLLTFNGTEGGLFDVLYRFGGSGPVLELMHAQKGALVINPAGLGFSFVSW